MAVKISKKVLDRFSTTLKGYQSIGVSHRARDVSEADTVTLVKDMLADVFGFDKYQELTSEHQIRGTYCDLAVKIDGKVNYLIEVKSAGTELNDAHLRQAVNYGAHQGIEWVVLTNAIDWRLYRIKFAQPIDFEVISSFKVPDINLKNEEDCKKLFLLCREGITTDAMDVYHQHTQILNRFVVAQVILAEPVLGAIRREMRRLFPELKVDQENISEMLTNEIFKREVIEGDKAKDTQTKIRKVTNKLAKVVEKREIAEQLGRLSGVTQVVSPLATE